MAMTPAGAWQQLWRGVLARQVEYSHGEADDRFTTMVPLAAPQLPLLRTLAATLPFAGEWDWAVQRFAQAVRPDALLLRMDWQRERATAITLYCRFPGEPDGAAFQQALTHARPFRWQATSSQAVASALGVPGPRGIALRSNTDGHCHTALYFKSDAHVGSVLGERLAALLAACGFPADLVARIASDLRPLYRPGPLGVVGVDDGPEGRPRALKFDPGNVPLAQAFGFLARLHAPPRRIEALRRIARDLRADAASYLGVQYGPADLLGWRLYFACEPGHASRPGSPAIDTQRHLRPLRRLPHH
jgi:hypothetical protein